MDEPRELARELQLLEEIHQDPDTTQATIADQLGVAVGTVNWHIKRLIAKGYVKVKRAERRKLRYILTPEGLALRARLTVAYVETSMQLYRRVRNQAREVIQAARAQGYELVCIQGDDGDIADVCRLTCLEQGMEVVGSPNGDGTACLSIQGQEIHFQTGALPGQKPETTGETIGGDESEE